MSEWKVGDKAYVPVEFVERSKGSDIYRFKHQESGSTFYLAGHEVLRSISPQPAPVDVSQIKVGDEVTVRGVVVDIDRTSMPYHVETSHNESVWVSGDEIISHTPSRPPSTLAEFDAMTPDQRERWFNEMVKGKVVA